MTSRRFVLAGVGLTLLLAAALAAFNVYMDEFGLYGLRTGAIRVWGYERASKLLLAQRYVPEHFEGLLLGSSSSDMAMDTRGLQGYAVYNLSITGGNVCEVARIAREALVRGRMRFIVLSLTPYLTKDCRMKTNELEPGLKQAALGSLFTVRFYRTKMHALAHPEEDPFRDSWSGFKHVMLASGGDFGGGRERPLSADAPVDSGAAGSLAELLQEARIRHVQVLAYFHPLLHPERNGGYPELYLQQMRTLLAGVGQLWDFNDGSYPQLTGDEDCFAEGAHLSKKGAALVMAEITRRLDAAVGRDGAHSAASGERP